MPRIQTNASSRRPAYRIATITLAISAILLTGIVPAFAQETPRIGASKAKPSSKASGATVSKTVDGLVSGVSSAGLKVDATPGGRTDPVTSAPPGGPKSPVTVPDVRADVVTAASDRTAKDEIASRVSDMPAEAIRGELGKALSSSATERPAFDQGMAGRPKISESDTAQFRGSAISRMTGGQVVGGPLGEAAAGTKNGPGGSGAAASGRVSDGSITAPATYSDDGVRGMGTAVRDAYAGGRLQGAADLISSNTDKTNLGRAMQSALCAENDCAPASSGTPATNTASNGPTSVTHPSGNTSTQVGGGSSQPGGQTTHTYGRDSQGRPTQQTVVNNNGDGTRTVTKQVIAYANDEDSVGKSRTTESTTGMCPQDLEGCGGKPSDSDIQRRLNDKNFQIVQQAKANGAVTPDRNDGLGARNTNAVIAVDAQSQLGQRLLGQPGQPGVGLNDGGASAPGFNDRNNGALDPGRDAVHTGGTGREQNRADDAINGRVGTPSGVPARSEEDKEKEEDKGKDKGGAASG